MSDPRPPVILSAPNRNFRVHEHFNSTTFEEDVGVLGEGQEPAIVWEITLPELIELASTSTNCKAVIDGWRGNKKVGQIKLEYADDYNSFTMAFVAQSDFTSLHVLSLSSPTWVVVINSAKEQRVVLIDSTTHKVLGGDTSPERLDVVIFPFKQVVSGLEGIRDGLDAFAQDGPQLVFQDQSVKAKQRCQQNRKAGWIVVVAGVIAAGLAIPTGGSSLLVVGLAAAAGAGGGAAAAVVDNDAETCMEEAEKKEEEEELEEEEEEEEDPA